MNRKTLATAGCIVLSIVFSLSFGFFIHFKVFWPDVSDVYEKTLYYPEELYDEYQKEAERMIAINKYTSHYPVQTIIYSKDNRTTLVMKIGEYGKRYSNYITVTVKNFETDEQEVTFERSRKSAEEAYEEAEKFRKNMSISTGIFVFILVIFTVYLIINSIKKRYSKVLTIMLSIVASIVTIIVMKPFL